jgi:hypothetical protein
MIVASMREAEKLYLEMVGFRVEETPEGPLLVDMLAEEPKHEEPGQ